LGDDHRASQQAERNSESTHETHITPLILVLLNTC
jgi:hypothetical protein